MSAPARDPERLVLCLVRHGRTASNAAHRFLGRTDEPLDAVGEAEVAALAAGLDVSLDAVYASPLRRARQTAAALGGEVRLVDGLVELDQGALEGLDGAEAMTRYPDFFAAWQRDPAAAAAPGGESFGALRERALHAVEQLARAHRPGEVVAVVTHQLVIAALASSAAGEGLAAWRRYTVRNASVSTLVGGPGLWRLLGLDWRPGSG